ncbi:MAG: UDP-N-acetylmuramoyl-L-alanyl-D-glutamate--2,6-diaminopimelate ligase [Desulfobulbaceae bacterium]|nr:UDP-N-acetylmuramoyl-L-alanyl-D-glutamate--2,6-diaminopimelate ligase [Desulfobulbaceae bacterium]
MNAQKKLSPARTLGELLPAAGLVCPPWFRDVAISGLTTDSRQVGPGQLFVALAGGSADGHDFLAQAVANGAAALLVEKAEKIPPGLAAKLAVVVVVDCRAVLAALAAAFYGQPQKEMKLFGITGTNGKTTTSYLLEAIIRAAGGEPGVIGTVNYRYRGREYPGAFTTPEPLTLFALMREMADSGVTHLVMEVSSHGLDLGRVAGVLFDLVMFTNLSRDHLDFHGTMAAYFAAKKSLFTGHLKETGAALVMLTESAEEADWGGRLLSELTASGRFRRFPAVAGGGEAPAVLPLLACGRERGELKSNWAKLSLAGISAELALPDGTTLALSSPLIGDFNLENILAAVGGGWLAGFTPEQLAVGVAAMRRVPGRMERVAVPAVGSPVQVFVDYAHTPDALARVLATLRRLGSGRLVVIFGCGGDRDRGKRPLMGEVAGRLADVVLITSDNPRSEAPAAIMAAIEHGLYPGGKALLGRGRVEGLLTGTGRGYDLIESRRQAIRLAVRYAQPGDVILLAGKGHEDYQLIGGKKFHFDDCQEAAVQMQVVR